jgi:flagellar assembly protein FliH
LSRVIKTAVGVRPARWELLAVDRRLAAPSPAPQAAPVPDPVAAARTEAEALLEHARVEAEKLRREAHEEGRREGEAAGRAEVLEVLAEARRVLDEAWEERRRLVAEALPDAVELALAVARRVVGRELQSSPEEVLDLARRLLASAPRGPVVLSAHPADAALLEGRRDALGEAVEVRPDTGLGLGDLVAETAAGTVEATVAGRIQRIEAVVREVAARAD